MALHKKNKSNLPRNSTATTFAERFKFLGLIGFAGIVFAGVVQFFGNITTLCTMDLFRSRCTSLGWQTESIDKLISSLSSSEFTVRIAAFLRLKEILSKQPETVNNAAPLFSAYFNQQYRIGSNVRAADDLSTRSSLEIIEAIALASKKVSRHQKFELISVDLQGADLSRLNFDGIDLTHVLLNDANLNDVGLEGSTIKDSRLDRVEAARLNLSKSIIIKTCLEGAQLKSANIQNATLREVDFNGANLTLANLSSSTLDKIRFGNALIEKSNFFNAKPIAISSLFQPKLKYQLTDIFLNNPDNIFSYDQKKYSQCYDR